MSIGIDYQHDTKRQLASLLREKERRLGLNDLHYFAKYICGYQDLTKRKRFHGEYCEFLQNQEDHFKLTLTPRGSLKTSIGIAHSVQEIVKNPNIRILLAHKKFSVATS